VQNIEDENFTIYELGIVWGSEQFKYSYVIIIPLLLFWIGIFVWFVYAILKYGKRYHQIDELSGEPINNFVIK
jgi:hypothetical protein